MTEYITKRQKIDQSNIIESSEQSWYQVNIRDAVNKSNSFNRVNFEKNQIFLFVEKGVMDFDDLIKIYISLKESNVGSIVSIVYEMNQVIITVDMSTTDEKQTIDNFQYTKNKQMIENVCSVFGLDSSRKVEIQDIIGRLEYYSKTKFIEDHVTMLPLCNNLLFMHMKLNKLDILPLIKWKYEINEYYSLIKVLNIRFLYDTLQISIMI
jgi:hypothetical protein